MSEHVYFEHDHNATAALERGGAHTQVERFLRRNPEALLARLDLLGSPEWLRVAGSRVAGSVLSDEAALELARAACRRLALLDEVAFTATLDSDFERVRSALRLSSAPLRRSNANYAQPRRRAEPGNHTSTDRSGREALAALVLRLSSSLARYNRLSRLTYDLLADRSLPLAQRCERSGVVVPAVARPPPLPPAPPPPPCIATGAKNCSRDADCCAIPRARRRV